MKTLIAALALLASTTHALAWTNCGIKPMTPLGSVKCTGKVHAICVCDSSGRNCRWVFVCETDD